jgi:mannose-6-phosphate isomerase-like protein (cupin superfamily)
MKAYQPINFEGKFARLAEQWSPRVIAEMNDYQFKVARLEGDFVWHHHPNTDETFIVLDGHLRIEFRDGAVELKAGEMFVVPKGVEHKPFAVVETKLLLVEPRGTPNTGTRAENGRLPSTFGFKHQHKCRAFEPGFYEFSPAGTAGNRPRSNPGQPSAVPAGLNHVS